MERRGMRGACGARDAGGDHGRGAGRAARVLREPGHPGQLGAGPRRAHGAHARPGAERRAGPGVHPGRGLRRRRRRRARGAAEPRAPGDRPGPLGRARRLGRPVVRGGVDAPGLPFAAESADVVIMSELIEHLVDTDSALDEAFRVLKPGGSLLMSTPTLAAWYNRGLVALGVQPIFSEVSLRGVYGRPGSQVAGHLHLFTRGALVGLLAARGFSSIGVRGARYHDVPRPLRRLDRAFCAWPAAASILLVHARKT